MPPISHQIISVMLGGASLALLLVAASPANLPPPLVEPAKQLTWGNPELDPRLGYRLEGPMRSLPRLGSIPTLRNTLIFYVGDCLGCAADKLDPNNSMAAGYEETIYVFRNSLKDLRPFRAKFGSSTLLADANGEMAGILNPRWLPRWYEVANGKLSAIQEFPEDASWKSK